MYRDNTNPIEDAELVTWNSKVYPDLSLEVPKPYHNEAERLLDAIEDPIDFFKNIESFKKEIRALDVSNVVADTVWNVIKEGEKDEGHGSARHQGLKEKLYLEVIHNSMYMYTGEEFNGTREEAYLDITNKIRKIDDYLKEID